MSIYINHYGLHTTPEGVVYLVQGRNSVNMLGLKAASPFEFSEKRKACPHMVNIATPTPDKNHWRIFMRLLPDTLVQELLPVPKGRTDLVPYLPDANNELLIHLVALSRMSSPLFQSVYPIGRLTLKQILADLSLTNISPLVLTNVRPADQELMYEIARESRMLPRKILFVGDPSVVIHAPMKRIQTALWDVEAAMISSLPMESLGSVIVKRYGRNEPFDMPQKEEV